MRKVPVTEMLSGVMGAPPKVGGWVRLLLLLLLCQPKRGTSLGNEDRNWCPFLFPQGNGILPTEHVLTLCYHQSYLYILPICKKEGHPNAINLFSSSIILLNRRRALGKFNWKALLQLSILPYHHRRHHHHVLLYRCRSCLRKLCA
jgi:hypothetical protein